MADKPTLVQVEVSRVDSSLFPVNFPYPLIDSFVRQNDDLKNTADLSNEAASSAYQATLKNEAQDITLDEHNKRITENKDKNDQQDQTLSSQAQALQDHDQRISDNKTKNDDQDIAIQGNADNIGQVSTDLGNHTGGNSEHGVTGDNVGTEDYCSELVGGVVLLAGNIAELNYAPITLADAPVAYDQTYTQQQTDAIKSLSTQLSALYDKVNEIIQGQIAAKQMDVSQP